MMAPAVPTPRSQSDQFLEVLTVIEALNVEAERLTRALAGASLFMSAEIRRGGDTDGSD